MKKTIFVVLFVSLVLGCSQQEELQKTSVRLKWLHQAQFAGIYAANDRGYYEDQGLDVDIKRGGVDAPAIPDVISGNSEFGVASADDLIVASADGKPVKAVAVIYKISPVVYFSLENSSIKAPYDFPGNTVGIKHGTGTDIPYITMLRVLDVNRTGINEVDVGFDLESFYSGEVDVWPGFRINEPFQARFEGYEVNEIYPEDYGVVMYADVLFTTDDMIENSPEKVESFVHATLDGWQYAVENEPETVEIVMKYATDTTREHQTFMLAKSIPLIHTGDSQLGYMDDKIWANTIDILLTNDVINKSIETGEVYTNEFVE